MAEPWRPANELEAELCGYVDRGELESFIHALREATVVIPGSAGQLGQGAAGWPITTVDDQTYVTVFTSPEALLADPDRRNLAYSSLTLEELAKLWPDPNWRLAVNPGLSIGVYVPGTLVLSTAVRLGAADPIAELLLPDVQRDGFQEIRGGTFTTQNSIERGLLQALRVGDAQLAIRSLFDGTLFLISTERDGYTLPGEAGFRWLTLRSDLGDAVPMFTSRDRVREGLGPNTYSALPIRLLDLSEMWPGDAPALVVNPGTPLSVRLPGPGVLGLTELAEKLGIAADGGDFRPGAAPDNGKLEAVASALHLYYQQGAQLQSREQHEHALLTAAANGDRAGFLTLLFSNTAGPNPRPISLRLPVHPGNDPGVRYAGQEFPWQTTTANGRTYLQVFTSPGLQRAVIGTSSRSSAEFEDLLRHWPNPEWDLVINGGTPIGAFLDGEHMAALSDWRDQAIAHELAQHFPAPPRTDQIDLQLLDAGRRGDRAGFLEILRVKRVKVVTPDRGLDWKTPPADPTFPWREVPVRGRRSILVYTSNLWKRGSGSSLSPVFGELAAAWPENGPDLVLNPGSPVSITMTAEEVRGFAQG